MKIETDYFWIAIALLFIFFAPASCKSKDRSIAEAIVIHLEK